MSRKELFESDQLIEQHDLVDSEITAETLRMKINDAQIELAKMMALNPKEKFTDLEENIKNMIQTGQLQVKEQTMHPEANIYDEADNLTNKRLQN